ncbi:MAG: glycosyltransferase family 9 protein [Candidatus Marinimicrobia bacterium]|nr:glycosyltransferase family 9 protein [Candidatus Neomarinimicrobiota bacterium]
MNSDRFLIIRLSSIGDIILTTPLVRALRKAYPDALIDYLVKEEFRELLVNNPHIDNVYSFDPANGIKDIIKWRKKIKRNGYNSILDLHGSIRSILMTRWLWRVELGKLNKKKFKRFFLAKLGINLYEQISPVTQRYFEAAQEYGLIDDGLGSELFHGDQIPNEMKNVVENKKYIVMAPGAGYFTKRWLPEYFAILADELIEKNKKEIFLIGSAADKGICDEIKKSMNNYVHDLSGNYGLLETAAIIDASDALITNDTGMMHIAVSQKIPVLAFFGSSTEELGFFPYSDNYSVLENNDLSCRPCSHVGRNSCPKGHFKCMKDISPRLAYTEFMQLMDSKT